MSAYRYREAAVMHGWEFLNLAHERQADIAQLHAFALEQPQRLADFIKANGDAVSELVNATPSRRQSMLRRIAGNDALSQIALILGAWQHCRKAVLAYDWIEEHPRHFTPGASYRSATVEQGWLFDGLRSREWTRWPRQWGPSPFADKDSPADEEDEDDFNPMMDNYDPATERY
ncbi:hypothetical protein ACU4GI_33360 [Cupriavidus basilensis]